MTANTKRTIETACIGPCSAPEYMSYMCTDIFPVTPSGALTVGETDTSDSVGILSIGNLAYSGGYSSDIAHALICDEAARLALFETLLPILELRGLKGVNFCFQYLYPFDRAAYSDFISTASQLLHRRGYLVFVSLPLRLENTLFHSGHDGEYISRLCDRVLLISRGQGRRSLPPGPDTTVSEIRRALDTAVSLIPTGKILLDLSVPACRWQLPWHMGDSGELMTNERAVLTSKAVGAKPSRDRMTNLPFYTYTAPGGGRFAVWYDDAVSIGERLALVDEFALAGICMSGTLCDSVMTGETAKRFKIEK